MTDTRPIVQVIRFTQDVPAMRSLLELIGLDVEVPGDGFCLLRSGGGDVLLHALDPADPKLPSGSTHLTIAVDDIAPVAKAFDAEITDEGFGPAIRAVDPLGHGVAVYESKQTVEAAPRPDLPATLVPIVFTDPAGPYGGFLERLGLTPDDGGDDRFATWSGYRGAVALHIDDDPANARLLADGPGPQVQPTFGVVTGLDEIANRLRHENYEFRLQEGDWPMVEVTDPDGRPLQIFQE